MKALLQLSLSKSGPHLNKMKALHSPNLPAVPFMHTSTNTCTHSLQNALALGVESSQ